MTSYAQASASVSAPAVRPERLCRAHGCRLPGTLSTATLGTQDDWYCRVHFGAQYADHGKITAKIANRYPLYRIAMKCANVAPGRLIPDELVAALKRHGRTDFLKAKPAIEGRPLTMRTLGAYMLKVLDAECTPLQTRTAGDQPAQSENAETWLDAGQVAGHEVAA